MADGPESAVRLDLERLLAPISAEKPAGESLRYDALYDGVREARREEDPSLPQGVWKTEPKKADWEEVEALCLEALERRSKDLQLAAWLCEAWVHQRGFAGLEQGLELLSGLIEGFWQHVHPQIGDDGDLEARLAPFDWLDQRLPLAVKAVPVTRPETEEGGVFRWAEWESALHRANRERSRSGKELEGQVDTSRFMISVSLTPSTFFLALDADLGRCRQAAEELVLLLEERGGSEAPPLRQLRETLEAIHRFLRGVLRQRMEEEEAAEPAAAAEPEVQPMTAPEESDSLFSGGGPIRGRAEAYRRLTEAADYLARTEPHSPTPYLVRRAVSWGSMSVAQLLRELLADKADLPTVFKLLGIQEGAGKS